MLCIGCSEVVPLPTPPSDSFCHSNEKQSLLLTDTLELRQRGLSAHNTDALCVL